TWASTDQAIASVNASGLATASSVGSTTISATSEGRAGQATLTVSAPAPAPVASVTVSPSSGSLDIGKTLQLSATLRDASGNVLTGRTVTWSSGSTAIASVDGSGLATALSTG